MLPFLMHNKYIKLLIFHLSRSQFAYVFNVTIMVSYVNYSTESIE